MFILKNPYLLFFINISKIKTSIHLIIINIFVFCNIPTIRKNIQVRLFLIQFLTRNSLLFIHEKKKKKKSCHLNISQWCIPLTKRNGLRFYLCFKDLYINISTSNQVGVIKNLNFLLGRKYFSLTMTSICIKEKIYFPCCTRRENIVITKVCII